MSRGSLWILLAAVCISDLARAQDAGTRAEEFALVLPMYGDVSVWQADTKKLKPCAQAMRLTKRDHVGSKGGNVARIGVEGSLVVTLKGVQPEEDQGLSISKADGKIVLELVRGSAVVESAETDISFLTPQGEVGGRGVSFLVEVTDDSARVVALDGTPTFTNDLGNVEVPAGCSTTVAGKGDAPADPTPADVDKETSWTLAAEKESNLVLDPGFEGFQGFEKGPWKTLQNQVLLQVDSAQFHGGKKSMRIHLNETQLKGHDDGQVWPILCQVRTGVLTSGARYFFRVWMRTENLTLDGAEVRLKVSVAPGWYKLPFREFACPSSEGEWRCARFFFTSDAEDFLVSTPRLDPRGTHGGRIWIDDVFLGQVSSRAADAGGK